ncbi:hypothetical protein CUJ83_08605 [Methanocella sp. CWC-04]|uniref:Uncharacterized protein n=1 Tax=Methanooceanicella nereidis TaxID=2052831 RepID=A0AAP2RE12_9EURY|nr:hypothetical protein [Methanocella sp. CWC-04]MCD1295056.1 hypothetical protein [Methanocella sp. CWC-04]
MRDSSGLLKWIHESVTIEAITAVLLALATVSSAWCVYEANKWNGIQAFEFGSANTIRTESIRNTTAANTNVIIDVTLFLQWVDAVSSNDTLRADFLKSRFRDEFRPAFEAWLALAGTGVEDNIPPKSPFSLPEYEVREGLESIRLSEAASAAFDRGRKANEIADSYILDTVFFALVLFLGSTSTKWKSERIRLSMLSLAFIIFFIALLYMISLPTSIGFYWFPNVG